MAQYKVCPGCGSNLDPGEICDCGKELFILDVELPGGAKRYNVEAYSATGAVKIAKNNGLTTGAAYVSVYLADKKTMKGNSANAILIDRVKL